MPKLMTFHRILPGCEEGNRETWRAFLEIYTPIVFQVFGVYSPWDLDTRWQRWPEALTAMTANQCEILRGLSHQSEREFLVGLRAFLLDWLAGKLDASGDAQDPPAPNREALAELLKGLPVTHQEIAFLALAGYSQATLEKVLRITPAVAGEGLNRLRSHYPMVVDRSQNRCFWPSAWIGLTRAARASGEKDCAPLRMLIRILDGQASWYDKDPVEKHRASCPHCLELWTSLREAVLWERLAEPLPAEKIEPLLAVVPLKAQEKPKTSLLARMFGK
jgi:hypothetical protein